MTPETLTPEVANYDPADPASALAIEAQRRMRRSDYERGQQLRSAIEVARQALILRERDGVTKLELLEAAFRVSQAATDKAQADCIAQRLANDATTVPLRNEIARLTALLNSPSPGYLHRSRQWLLPEGTKPLPDTDHVTIMHNGPLGHVPG